MSLKTTTDKVSPYASHSDTLLWKQKQVDLNENRSIFRAMML